MGGRNTMGKEPVMHITYTEGADGLFYPNIAISKKEPRAFVGKFATMWKNYMVEKYPLRMTHLVMTGMLPYKMMEVEETMEYKKEELIQELLKAQPYPITEYPLERAAHLKMLYKRAEEILIEEVLFTI